MTQDTILDLKPAALLWLVRAETALRMALIEAKPRLHAQDSFGQILRGAGGIIAEMLETETTAAQREILRRQMHRWLAAARKGDATLLAALGDAERAAPPPAENPSECEKPIDIPTP